MGADYAAHTFLGFKIEKRDLVDVETVRVTTCDHPSAVGKKFCPECGLPEARRTSTTKRESWKPVVKPTGRRPGSVPRNFEDLMSSDEGKVNGLQIYSLANCSEDDDRRGLILGFELGCCNAEGDADENPMAADAQEVVLQIEILQEVAAELGLAARPIQFWTLCYVSI